MTPPWPSTSLPPDKHQARALAKARLLSPPPDAAKAAHNLLHSGVLPTTGRWAIYRPLLREAPLGPLLDLPLVHRVAYARCSSPTELLFVAWDGSAAFEPDEAGLPAPPAHSPVVDAILTAVLVPGLAFDDTGGRLGRGKGYYDRALQRLPLPLRVVVTFESQLFSRVPTAPHDEQVDVVVTEERVHWTGARGLGPPVRI